MLLQKRWPQPQNPTTRCLSNLPTGLSDLSRQLEVICLKCSLDLPFTSTTTESSPQLQLDLSSLLTVPFLVPPLGFEDAKAVAEYAKLNILAQAGFDDSGHLGIRDVPLRFRPQATLVVLPAETEETSFHLSLHQNRQDTHNLELKYLWSSCSQISYVKQLYAAWSSIASAYVDITIAYQRFYMSRSRKEFIGHQSTIGSINAFFDELQGVETSLRSAVTIDSYTAAQMRYQLTIPIHRQHSDPIRSMGTSH